MIKKGILIRLTIRMNLSLIGIALMMKNGCEKGRNKVNIEKLTKRLSIHNKELKIPTKHMPAILDIIEYMKTQTKKREKK